MRGLVRLSCWFLVGCGLVLAFQACFVWQHGGNWTVLIRAGSENPSRARMESELGPIVFLDARGHDGQINYLIARDPFCRRGTGALLGTFDNPPYRYRRILYPLLAGSFGSAGPRAALLGLVAWTMIGGGLIAAAGADLCLRHRLSRTVLVLMLLNPGIYLAAQVLTADVLATGMALAGVVLWQRQWPRVAALALAAAVLVRETSLLVSLALVLDLLARRRPRPALLLAASSGLPWLVWSVWVHWAIPGGDGLENISLPFAGIVTSLAVWSAEGAVNVVLGDLALVLIAAAFYFAWRTTDRFVAFSCLLWACLAVLLSLDVWGEPGNALRAMTPLWAFVALAYGIGEKSPVAIAGEEAREPASHRKCLSGVQV